MKLSVWWIFFLFLALRLILVFHLPIFNDESTYMRWGIGFLQAPERWWAFMLDGKQPGVAITMGLSQKFPWDPLISMRLLSIFWSSITFWTVYGLVGFLVKESENRMRARYIGLLLLAVAPYMILFDTLALAESATTAAFVSVFFFTLSFFQKPSMSKGIAIGCVVALGWWFKSTILLSLPLIVLTGLWYWKIWKRDVLSVILSLATGAAIGVLLVSPVLFNPNIDYKNTAVIARTVSLPTLFTFPWASWWNNISAVIQWFIAFGGPLLVGAWGVSLWKFQKVKEVQVLALWVVVPIVAEVFLLTSISARLLVMSVVPLILAVAMWLSYQRLPAGKAGVSMVIYSLIGSVLVFGLLLSFFPLHFYRVLAPLPKAQGDFGQYVVSWPSGWGVKEAADLLIAESKKRRIIVFVRLDGGNPEDAIISYMERAKIPIFYIQQINDIAKIKELALVDWYFVSRGPQYAKMEKYLTEVAKFSKPLDPEFVGVYKINP
jgi:hypothetical protein